VQRTSLTVRVVIDADDSVRMARVGITPVGISVRLQRNASTEAVRTAQTDADGLARFDQLLEGQYEVSMSRTLSAEETARLSPADQYATVLAGGASIVLSPPTARTITVAMVASQRGSLVLSELYWTRPSFGTGLYAFGDYVELTNVSDTTIFLDGMLLLRGASVIHANFAPNASCEGNRAFRLDSTAVWAGAIYRLPGEGREHPIPAGEARVVAIDAIDHGAIVGGLPNLSMATFEEFGLDGDVDNPFAANITRLTHGSPIAIHGFPLTQGRLYGVALPIARDTTTLERRPLATLANGVVGEGVFRIPRAAVLDVAGFVGTPERQAFLGSDWVECDPWVSPVFERAPSRLMDETRNFAIRRKSLGRTASGIELLQRTRTGARDFELAQPLRRSLNK
jgi:hypothetical protein